MATKKTTKKSSKTVSKYTKNKTTNPKELKKEIKENSTSELSKKEVKTNAKIISKNVEKNKKNSKKSLDSLDNKADNKPTETTTFVEKDIASKNLFFTSERILAVVTGIVAIALMAAFSFYYFPEKILSKTDETIIAKKEKENAEKKEKEAREDAAIAKSNKEKLEKLLEVENKIFDFNTQKDFTSSLNFNNYGVVNFTTSISKTPKSTENFLRLVYRDYYNNNKVFNAIKNEESSYLLFGDAENNDGTGGRSSNYLSPLQPGYIKNELWETPPQFSQENDVNTVTNDLKFLNPEYMTSFDQDSGTVTYKKGVLAFVPSISSLDSVNSKLVLFLKDSKLPAIYSPFAYVSSSEDMAVVDKIYNELSVIDTANNADGSGKPKNDIIIEDLEITSPNIEN